MWTEQQSIDLTTEEDLYPLIYGVEQIPPSVIIQSQPCCVPPNWKSEREKNREKIIAEDKYK